MNNTLFTDEQYIPYGEVKQNRTAAQNGMNSAVWTNEWIVASVRMNNTFFMDEQYSVRMNSVFCQMDSTNRMWTVIDEQYSHEQYSREQVIRKEVLNIIRITSANLFKF